MIRAIFAVDDDWGIGKDGSLPWPHNSADLRWFKECTIGHTVVMGRKTWDSLPMKPLKGRKNIVITSTPVDRGVFSCYMQWFLDNHQYLRNDSGDIWIIGGARLISGSLDIIEEIWLSRISGSYGCDTFLPIDEIFSRFVEYDSVNTDDGLRITKLSRR